MKKLVAITGATGFIGSEVTGALKRSGFAVRPILRKRSNIENSVEVGEIGPTTNWKDALRGVDCVVHCAGRAHVLRETAVDPMAEFRRVNRDGTLNLAENAAAAGVKRFIFLSSIGVMGSSTDGRAPFSETDKPRPAAGYSVSKHEAECGLKEISRRTGLEVVILRPPLVYGPAAPGNFSRLIQALKKGWPLPLGSVSRNLRSYVGVTNLADFVVVCIDHPAAASEEFLISDGEDVSTVDLLRRMGKALGRSPRLLPVPVGLIRMGAAVLGKAAIAQSMCGSLQVDSAKARQVLNWRPPVDFNTGIHQAVEGLK